MNNFFFFFFRSFSASLACGIKHRKYSDFLCWSRQTLAYLEHMNPAHGPMSRTISTFDSKIQSLYYSRSQEHLSILWIEKWPRWLQWFSRATFFCEMLISCNKMWSHHKTKLIYDKQNFKMILTQRPFPYTNVNFNRKYHFKCHKQLDRRKREIRNRNFKVNWIQTFMMSFCLQFQCFKCEQPYFVTVVTVLVVK